MSHFSIHWTSDSDTSQWLMGVTELWESPSASLGQLWCFHQDYKDSKFVCAIYYFFLAIKSNTPFHSHESDQSWLDSFSTIGAFSQFTYIILYTFDIYFYSQSMPSVYYCWRWLSEYEALMLFFPNIFFRLGLDSQHSSASPKNYN